MKRSVVAFFVCLLIVLGALAAWELTLGRFNPIPSTTTLGGDACPLEGTCGSFSVISASLTFANLTDIQTQALTVTVIPAGGFGVAGLQAFIDNVSLGTAKGPYAPGQNGTAVFAVPTTITLTAGTRYSLTLVGYYDDPSSGAQVGTYSQTLSVVATQVMEG